MHAKVIQEMVIRQVFEDMVVRKVFDEMLVGQVFVEIPNCAMNGTFMVDLNLGCEGLDEWMDEGGGVE
jgi:hypothetical protein